MSLGEIPARSTMRGYYHCEDGTDSSGNGNNLTNNGGLGAFNPAKFNNGFNTGTTGTTKALGIATNIMSALKNPNQTVSCWVKFNSTSNTLARIIWQIATNALTTGSLSTVYYTITGGVMAIYAYQDLTTTDSIATYTLPSLPSTNEWLNIIYVKTSSITADLYVNGKLQATNTGSGTETCVAAAINYNFTLGNSRNLAAQGFIAIDEVIVEERVWSASEIRKYYTQAKKQLIIQ